MNPFHGIAAKLSLNKPVILGGAVLVLAARGDCVEAEPHYREALRLQPDPAAPQAAAAQARLRIPGAPPEP